MRGYFSVAYLEAHVKKNGSLIYRALLKYGYSNFSLDIVEYCDSAEVLLREQYYLDLLKPDYNLLKQAGSSLGFQHSADTIAKFKARCYTPEQEAERLKKLKIHNASETQKELLKRLHIIQSQRVEILDILSNETTVYSSFSEAASALGCYKTNIGKAIEYLKEKGVSRLINKRYRVIIEGFYNPVALGRNGPAGKKNY